LTRENAQAAVNEAFREMAAERSHHQPAAETDSAE
jgi:hypothetical protein